MRPLSTKVAAVVGLFLLVGCRPPEATSPTAAPVPITTEFTATGPFQASLTLLGTAEPQAVVTIRTPAAGTLRVEPAALKTGREVRRGELLFRVESPDLRLALKEAELLEKSAAHELERARRGVEGGFLPEAELARRQIEHELATERLDGARDAQERLGVRAPVAGRLKVAGTPTSGMEVRPDLTIADIDAAGTRRVEAWAAAVDLGQIEVGLDVECRSANGERLLGRGRLSEVDARLDDAGVARVIASIDDEIDMPTSGDGVELVVLLPAKDDALTVPSRALIIDGSLTSIFVLEASGRVLVARARPVATGGRRGERVEVLEGLEVGEQIAVDGAELLADGLEAKDVDAKNALGERIP